MWCPTTDLTERIGTTEVDTTHATQQSTAHHEIARSSPAVHVQRTYESSTTYELTIASLFNDLHFVVAFTVKAQAHWGAPISGIAPTPAVPPNAWS